MDRSLTCIHFPRCGGCTALDVPYRAQLLQKRETLQRLFFSMDVEIPPVVFSPQSTHYRHKVQLPFASQGQGSARKLSLGCYALESHWVVDQKECLLQDRDLTRVAHIIREWAQRSGLGSYSERTGIGFFRHVLLRRGSGTGEILIGIVTNGSRPAASRNMARLLLEKVEKVLRPENSRVVGVVQNINTRSTNVVLGNQEELWWGRPFLKEMLGTFQFRVGLSTFFQVNPYLTPRLYDLILDWVPQNAKVLDVYSGVGSITLWLSGKASQVVGIEENRDSVKGARESAMHNKVKNVRFLTGDAAVVVPQIAHDFDMAVVDPPRKGLELNVLAALRDSTLRRIVYVSCNPHTLLKDIQQLAPRFHLVSLTGVDMFPHTDHVECVSVLERKS